MANKLPPKGGNLGGSNASAVDPYQKRNFGSAPLAGQGGKAYQSGGNVAGVHQKPTKTPGGVNTKQTGHAASKPKQSHY